jgi:hypothetical protein
MNSQIAEISRTRTRAQQPGTPHVEVFWSTQTGRVILVGCLCELGRGHTYQEGVDDRLALKIERAADLAGCEHESELDAAEWGCAEA